MKTLERSSTKSAFAVNIKKIRKNRGLVRLNQFQDFLKKNGIDKSYWTLIAWEQTRTSPNLDTIDELAKVLEVSPLAFFEGLRIERDERAQKINKINEVLEDMNEEKLENILKMVSFMEVSD
jgi:transcriptional regulator with XRE-family HTH domain